MSAPAIDGLPGSRFARITGAMYLLYIAATVLADMLAHIGTGTPAQAYETSITSPMSFDVGLVVAFVSALLFVTTAWCLYVLLRPRNPDLALLFLLLNAIGVAIQCASLLALVAATLPGDAGARLQPYSADQLEGLTYLAISTYKVSFATAQLFFGAWLFPLGYLVYRSGFLPRALGALLLLDGVAVLIWFVQALVFPDYKALTYPGLAVSFVAEVGLALWLLARGIGVRPASAAPAAPAAPMPA